jgi:hypothetical protein
MMSSMKRSMAASEDLAHFFRVNAAEAASGVNHGAFERLRGGSSAQRADVGGIARFEDFQSGSFCSSDSGIELTHQR